MDTGETNTWAETLGAAAHPTRLMILRELLSDVKCVNEIQEILDIPQPNVSRHLKELRHCGLVDCYQDGARHCYYLTKPAMVRALFDLLERDYPVVNPRKKGLGPSSAGA